MLDVTNLDTLIAVEIDDRVFEHWTSMSGAEWILMGLHFLSCFSVHLNIDLCTRASERSLDFLSIGELVLVSLLSHKVQLEWDLSNEFMR